MELLVFFFSSTVVFCVICELVKFQLRASRLDFPSLWAIPCVGNVQLLQLLLSKDPLVDHQKIIGRFPEFFKCWIFDFRFLCPHSPAAVRKILTSEACLGRPEFAKVMFSGFSGDSYHEWVGKRNFMNRMFRVKCLKDAVEGIGVVAGGFCDDFEKEIGENFDIYQVIARWTVKVHCWFLMGVSDDNSVNGVIERIERFGNY
jgi:hypothetical protein